MQAQETITTGRARWREALLLTLWFDAAPYLTPFGLVRRWVVGYTLEIFWIVISGLAWRQILLFVVTKKEGSSSSMWSGTGGDLRI